MPDNINSNKEKAKYFFKLELIINSAHAFTQDNYSKIMRKEAGSKFIIFSKKYIFNTSLTYTAIFVSVHQCCFYHAVVKIKLGLSANCLTIKISKQLYFPYGRDEKRLSLGWLKLKLVTTVINR
ncbi:hypothetical protein BpHYR1_013187 [Brachionus plicatilis]|uniref:Uncharacterized protein n=1 Tax=Brachionus plicatilis TaxID=10195 RepID=A0A3M7QSY7_BRAPC|nr:hypothetical protein BpHYR1_013187 [Brachionus plicatilis]